MPITQSFKDILGIDTLLLGLALPDCKVHSPNENFAIENFHAGIRLNRRAARTNRGDLMKKFFAICLLSFAIAFSRVCGEDDPGEERLPFPQQAGEQREEYVYRRLGRSAKPDSQTAPEIDYQTFILQEVDAPSILVRPVIHRIRKQMLPTRLEIETGFRIFDGGKAGWSRTAAGRKKPSPIPAQHLTKEPDPIRRITSETAAPMATIKPEALREFSEQPAEVQGLIRNSLALTEQNLSYKYGSADPAAGGMDCSGFIYYVLSNAGYKDVPRDSAGQYEWVRKSSDFHSVLSRSGDSFELNDLKPGDLLFWSGTYKVDRDIPITHVMIYLGKEKSTDKPVMVGSTDGRSYEGVRRFGVSVFDFKMPSGKPNKSDPDLTAKFEGYASIPGLRQVDVVSKNQVNPEQDRSRATGEDLKPKAKPTTNYVGNGD